MQLIKIEKLIPHPDNPRFIIEVEQLKAVIKAEGFDEAHALIVRPLGDDYQIISGHRRHKAGLELDLKELPCFVKNYNDEETHIKLVTSNSQFELHPLEKGNHALKSVILKNKHEKGIRAYAKIVGREKEFAQVSLEVRAAQVQNVTHVTFGDYRDHWRKLAEIHAAPEWQWSAFATQAINWTVQRTVSDIQRLKEVKPYEWLDKDKLATALVCNYLTVNDYNRFEQVINETLAIINVKDAYQALLNKIQTELIEITYGKLSGICDDFAAIYREQTKIKELAIRQAAKITVDLCTLRKSIANFYMTMDQIPADIDLTEVANALEEDYTSLINSLIILQKTTHPDKPYNMKDHTKTLTTNFPLLIKRHTT
jgi:ParB/RepB/Spo0J family partition protein